MKDNSDAIGRGLMLYRRGDLAGAKAEVEAALRTDPDSASLLQLLGILCCRAGALREGAGHLSRSLELDPADPGTRLALANALVALGALEEAEALCRPGPWGEAAPPLWRLRGYVLQTQARFEEAARCYEQIVAKDPNDWEIWNNLGNARRAAGALAGAIEALERARLLRPDLPAIQLNLGMSLAEAGRLEEGARAFGEAARLGPDNPAALLELGTALRHLGRHGEALPALERAARLAPATPDIHLERGRAFAGLRRFDEAEGAYRSALRAQPGLAAAFLELGILLERASRLDRLADLLREARSAGVAEDELAWLRALALEREGKLPEALALAQAAPAGPEPVPRLLLVGRLADKLNQIETAFAAFAAMNRLVRTERAESKSGAASYRQHVAALIELVTPEIHASWQPASPDDGRPAPVFLVGFPRSGTTLLDTLLMGHPAVHVLEEEPILQRVGEALGDFARLPELSGEEANRLRALYFEELDAFDPAARGKLVVDKLPLNILGAPLIHRLFPDAKLIFAQRDPRDVVLSCFMQNFELNDAMANFLDLGDAASLYDLVLKFWTRCREVFPLSVHTVRYEALVEDIEVEIRPLIAYLDLAWDERVLDHRKTAATRSPIATPSYAQVTERIYDRASGRWERYRVQMAEVLPILAPWAERLGYDDVTAFAAGKSGP
jgi:tetratricopeptide (TPR) repeat protein